MKIIDTLQNHNVRVLLVGGIVRDQQIALLRGETPTLTGDIDLMISRPGAEMDAFTAEITSILTGYRVDAVGKAFGILKVVDEEGQDYDLAFPRTEISTGPGYRDVQVTGNPGLAPEEDLARRDFTWNAMAIDTGTGELLDPFGGKQDLKDHVIRMVGCPQARLREDFTRAFRAAGFIAREGYTPDPALVQAVRDLGPELLPAIPVERIFKEFHNPEKPGKTILSGPFAVQALDFLRLTGLLELVIPEFGDTVGFEQHNPHHHATVDRHLLNVAAYAAAAGAGPEAVFAGLLHDLGKPATFALKDGRGTFYGHEHVGADIAQRICDRLKAPTLFTEQVVTAVALHMQPGQVSGEASARRLAHRAGRSLETLLALYAADRADHCLEEDTATHADFIRNSLGSISVTFSERDLALNGRDLMALGLQGTTIGTVKRALAELVINGDLPNEQPTLLTYAKAHLI